MTRYFPYIVMVSGIVVLILAGVARPVQYGVAPTSADMPTAVAERQEELTEAERTLDMLREQLASPARAPDVRG